LLPIRVVTVTAPAVIADLMRHGGSSAAFDVVAELTGRRGLESRIKRLRPELVVIGLARGESVAPIEAILLTLPAAIVLSITDNGPRAVGYELRVHPTNLNDASAEAMAAFVRRVTQTSLGRRGLPRSV
jgi:hypothetical protein